jgi:hypothetical protein
MAVATVPLPSELLGDITYEERVENFGIGILEVGVTETKKVRTKGPEHV